MRTLVLQRILALVLIWVAGLVASPAVNAVAISDEPLFLGGADPRLLLLLSRDHQLYIKAYTDYSDLDGDGILDTSYNDAIDYYGYFDPKKCYVYSTSDKRFNPDSAASGTSSHECTLMWSGNFLNWATMTRMDVLRKVLYGGYRSTDADATSTPATVLERVVLPRDVHAFAKVFEPAGATDTDKRNVMKKFTPYDQTAISLCNVTNATSGLTKDINPATNPPVIRVAKGSWKRWAAAEVTQCEWGTGVRPSSTSDQLADNVEVRVAVCVSDALKEQNCKKYPNNNLKPTGLIQTYGDKDVKVRLQFGLMTGSFAKNKKGGVLRKAIGNTFDTEINSTTGRFANQGATDVGVINTVSRLRISGYDMGTNKYANSCGDPGILTFTDGQCVDWGNPIGEMYLEALNYISGKTAPTADFSAADSGFISSLPTISSWADPLPSDQWCAQTNIVTISTGLNSFDTDQLTNDIGFDAAALTNTVGTKEAINGGSFLIGQNGTDNSKRCTAKTLTNLADAKGVCPEVPSLEGGYQIAGLAYGTQTKDLRAAYQSLRRTRWLNTRPEFVDRQPIFNYAVALAESLPRFEIPVGTGTVNVLPACEANSTAAATAATANWRVCSMTDLVIESLTYDSAGAKLVAGSMLVNWEDSTWGNDYDMDGIERLEFCVGDQCSPALLSDQIKITASAAQANAGHALRFGYTVTGTTQDSIYLDVLRPGGANFNIGSALPATVSGPQSRTFTNGASTAKLLENPLWYMAKYGGPGAVLDLDKDGTIGDAGDWDADGDGQPDNYFKVTNPARLEEALGKVFSGAAETSSAASAVASNSTSLRTGGRLFQAVFQPKNWSGQLLSFDASNPSATADWDAGAKLNARDIAATPRTIITFGASDGVAFRWNATTPVLTSTQQANLNTDANGVADGRGADRVAYLRGDDANEGTAVTSFRARADGPLGDIVSSGPWFVGAPEAGYADVDEIPCHGLGPTDTCDYEAYSAFRQQHLTTTPRKPMVYVGANDGMLHGFHACATGTTCGDELIAYVPSKVYPNLSRLTDQRYNNNHRYFVDGSPMAGDVLLKQSSGRYEWRTVLVGGLRAGGRAFFALDVTDPAQFTESNAASLVLWEFTDAHDIDVGLTYNEPIRASAALRPLQIGKVKVKLPSGPEVTKWAVIVGNGYNSARGYAALYLLFIEDGVDGTWSKDTVSTNLVTGDFIKIRVPCASEDTTIATDPTCNDGNGLSTPIPFDSDGDGFVDTVYAGDLRGNMWKFLVGPQSFETASPTITTTPTTWKVAFDGKPLFVATDASSNRQPITAGAQATVHQLGGQLVLFGTGRYLETGDKTNADQQSFYGVWDVNADNAAPTGSQPAKVLKTDLLARTAAISAGSTMVIGDNSVNVSWRTAANTSGKLGWYFDFSQTRERSPSNPALDQGLLVFASLIPSSAACDFGGSSYAYGLDPINGYTPNYPVFDTNSDGVVNASDALGGPRLDAVIGGVTLLRGQKAGDLGLGVASTATGELKRMPIRFAPGFRGRISWRELLQ